MVINLAVEHAGVPSVGRDERLVSRWRRILDGQPRVAQGDLAGPAPSRCGRARDAFGRRLAGAPSPPPVRRPYRSPQRSRTSSALRRLHVEADRCGELADAVRVRRLFRTDVFKPSTTGSSRPLGQLGAPRRGACLVATARQLGRPAAITFRYYSDTQSDERSPRGLRPSGRPE